MQSFLTVGPFQARPPRSRYLLGRPKECTRRSVGVACTGLAALVDGHTSLPQLNVFHQAIPFCVGPSKEFLSAVKRCGTRRLRVSRVEASQLIEWPGVRALGEA